MDNEDGLSYGSQTHDLAHEKMGHCDFVPAKSGINWEKKTEVFERQLKGRHENYQNLMGSTETTSEDSV